MCMFWMRKSSTVWMFAFSEWLVTAWWFPVEFSWRWTRNDSRWIVAAQFVYILNGTKLYLLTSLLPSPVERWILQCIEIARQICSHWIRFFVDVWLWHNDFVWCDIHVALKWSDNVVLLKYPPRHNTVNVNVIQH